MPDFTALSHKSGISVPVLQAIASAGQRHAQRVVLYGSRARGDHYPESDIDIAFNVRYITDAVKSIDEEQFLIKLNSNISPCVLVPTEGEDFLYLVLPVRTAG